jgi:ATP-dependent RNA helicase DeaD
MTIIEPREQRLLRAVEQHTKAKITVAAVPSLGDLLAKRLERTKASIQETLEAGELEDFRRVVEALSASAEPADIAAAAIKLVYRSHGGERAEEEIPAVSTRPPEPYRSSRPSYGSAPQQGDRARARLAAVRVAVVGRPEPCGSMSGPGGRQGSGRAISSVPLPMKRACPRA